MKLRSPRSLREPERERGQRDGRRRPRNPRALRLEKAREERRERGGDGAERDPTEITGVLPRAGETAAAVALFGGLLLIALPQHTASIVRMLLVALAAVAALWALSRLVPEAGVGGWWRSPFEHPSEGRTLRPSGELARIRSMMAGRRQRLAPGTALPPDIIRMLRPLVIAALERRGHDPTDPAGRPAIRRLLSRPAWSVLDADPRYLPRWHETRRGDTRRVADVVRQILDELERLGP